MNGGHRIIKVKDHWEVHDDNGKFLLSGDTYDECERDLIEMLAYIANQQIRKEIAV